jgi:glyoxylase I family protein
VTLVGFEHVGMTVADLDRTIAFYCGLLGLRLVVRKPQSGGN